MSLQPDLQTVLLDAAAAMKKAAAGMEALLLRAAEGPEPHMTVREVAKLLKVSVNAVGNEIRSGALKAVRIGKGKKHMYRVKVSELAAFEKRRSGGAR